MAHPPREVIQAVTVTEVCFMQSTTTGQPAARNGSVKVQRRRPWMRVALQWIRRTHLYAGLFMLPWAMLYGVTAFLFNHPRAFPDHPQRIWTRDDFAGTPLEYPTSAARDAEGVVAALNERLGHNGSRQSPLHLVDPDLATYTRDSISARVRGAGQEHAVLLDISSGTAVVQTAMQTESELPPFAARGLKIPGSLSERVRSGLPAAFKQHGLSGDDVGIAIGTTLVFPVEADERHWIAEYNVQTGSVTGHPAETAKAFSWRQFLIDLHRAHGYPSQDTARWFWAMAVDAMFVSMVFWSLSGLCMWWQIKSVRIPGAVVLASSLAASGWMAWSMLNAMSAF
jgi:hypothetical protein